MKGTGRLFLQFHPFRFDLFCRPLWRICAIRNGIEAEISFVPLSPDFPRENSLPFVPCYAINEWSCEAGRMKGEERRISKAGYNESLSLLSRIDREMFVRFWVQSGNVSQCWNYYNSVKYFLLMYKMFQIDLHLISLFNVNLILSLNLIITHY